MIRVLFLVLLMLSQFSCLLTDNFSEEPMFLEIDTVDFVSSDNSISPSHKILDVTVFVDGENVGVFPVPARVPVLGAGTVNVSVFAGIRNNGVALAPKVYPFYDRFEKTYDFEANKVISLNLDFDYLPEAKFAFNEDFEGDHLFTLDLDEEDNSTMVKSMGTPHGTFCGRVDVTNENSLFQQGTIDIFQTDVFQGPEVYLEMDYKCDVPFIVGFIGYDDTRSVQDSFIALFESDEWDKVYLDLSLVLNGGEFDSYQIFIAGAGNRVCDRMRDDCCEGNCDGEEDCCNEDIECCNEGSIWIDNVRLVYI